jgi:DNA-binding response OmpR family regulator
MHKILIVEDEATLRDSYELILSTRPYSTSVASDGAKALELCQKTAFDLILLDIMMPHVDGVTFLKRYKDMGLPDVKVIIMSNLSSGDELAKAMALGADKSIVKADMSPKQLLDMVHAELPSD